MAKKNQPMPKELIRGSDGRLREPTPEEYRSEQHVSRRKEERRVRNLQAQENLDRLSMTSDAADKKWGKRK